MVIRYWHNHHIIVVQLPNLEAMEVTPQDKSWTLHMPTTCSEHPPLVILLTPRSLEQSRPLCFQSSERCTRLDEWSEAKQIEMGRRA